MVWEFTTGDTNTKTQLSLAAALFFSPLVQNMLKNNTRDITEQDKDFIRWYIKFGYITLLFWIITIVTGVMNYLLALDILNVIYTVSIFILIGLLAISVVSILSDIRLLKWGDEHGNIHTIDGNKKDILVKYLPLYNIYLWYNVHSFDTPNWRIKESLFLWIVFFIVSMTWNIAASTIVLIAIILRVAALMSDIDFFTTKTKQRFNPLFLKNPEEIRWYATWCISYLVKSIWRVFSKLPAYNLAKEVAEEKEQYSRIVNIKEHKNIIIEYILWILLTIGLVYITQPDFTVRTYYVWFGLLIWRYVVMAIQLKHLPHLPVAREIVLFTEWIWLLFRKKPH